MLLELANEAYLSLFYMAFKGLSSQYESEGGKSSLVLNSGKIMPKKVSCVQDFENIFSILGR